MRLEITRRAHLAVRVVRALQPIGTRRKSSELAVELDATPGFLAQVATPLVRRGWVTSVPGPTGGYQATRDDLSVLDVVEAVDGPTDDGRCVVEGGPCHLSEPCALHHAWAAARASLTEILAATPLVPPSEPTTLTHPTRSSS